MAESVFERWFRHVRIVHLIYRKSLKMVSRNGANRWLGLLGVLLVFGGLFSLWLLTRSQSNSYLSSQPYAQLKFDFECMRRDSGSTAAGEFRQTQSWFAAPNNIHCDPVASGNGDSSLTTSDVFKTWIDSGSISSDDKYSVRLLSLLSSLMMNGLPLVGVDDFLRISDAANIFLDGSVKQSLMLSSAVRDQFDTLLRVREKKLIFTPDNACVRELVASLRASSERFQRLNVDIVQDADLFLQSKHCCTNLWAMIDMRPVVSDHEDPLSCNLNATVPLFNFTEFTQHAKSLNEPSSIREDWNDIQHLLFSAGDRPSVTIRMHPSAVPDTRNFDWTPLKRIPSRLQSGELLYFTSGFLSLQLEIQQFVKWKQTGHRPNLSAGYATLDGVVAHSNAKAMELASLILNSTSHEELHDNLRHWSQPDMQPTSAGHFSVYHRAFPTREYSENLFWRLFGLLMTISLIMFFTLPSAISVGAFKHEWTDGQLDMLSTLPTVMLAHSMVAWCLVSISLTLGLGSIGFAFFYTILQHSRPLMVTVGLILLGISLAPIGVIFSLLANKADSLVLIIPLFAFVGMLPGLIYFDLAFDVQRSFWLEMLMCLCPPSAAALLLRLCFSNEAMGIAVGWLHTAPVSKTTALSYIVMLAADCILWFAIACVWLSAVEAKSTLLSVSLLSRLVQCLGNAFARFRAYCSTHRRSYHYHSLSHDDLSGSLGDMGTHFMEIRNVSKSFLVENDPISVLNNVCADLLARKVTVLLGSNGAGKTTFLRVLAGLDVDYRGSVKRSSPSVQRGIGWCPQNDPLFDFLTPFEHLEFFERLVMESDVSRRCPLCVLHDRIRLALQSLIMIEHGNKLSHQLSGGMKRRLTLALACVGNPQILLLDEPTSGCDSWTREIVRKEIMSRKAFASVVVSTHHSDDVEVLADHVWFLNERHLVVNDDVDVLFNNQFASIRHYQLSVNQDSSECSGFSNRPIKFTTNSLLVKAQFVSNFGESLAMVMQPTGIVQHVPPFIWHVPANYVPQLISFVNFLDGSHENDWTIEHLTVFSAICRHYANDPNQRNDEHIESRQNHRLSSPFRSPIKSQIVHNPTGTPLKQDSASLALPHLTTNSDNRWQRSIFAIFRLRYWEIKKNFRSILLAQLLLPFASCVFLAWACHDASYPSVSITSNNLHGLGEILIAGSRLAPNMQRGIEGLLQSELASVSARWRPEQSSDELWSSLFNEYYSHPSPRWAAAVMDDSLSDWFETQLRVNTRDLNLTAVQIESEFDKMRAESCHESRCHSFASVELMPWNSTSPYLSIRSRQQLTTNITLLSNVTSDHAAPIFVKEALDPILSAYSCIGAGVADCNASFARGQRASFELYNYPLPDSDVMNHKYLERGFLGATIATMFLLMSCASAGKVVTKLNSSRFKRLLFLSGIPRSVYLLGNWFVDWFRMFVVLCAMLLGIYCAGGPVSRYLFVAPPADGMLLLLSVWLFAMAATSSSYALIWLWTDSLASQLFLLLTTVSGGVFLKMYLDRHHSLSARAAADMCTLLSPSYAFATILFDLFAAFTKSVLKTANLDAARLLMSDRLTRVRYCCWVLAGQSLFYLTVTYAIDAYHKHMIRYVNALSWSFSAQWMCYDNANMLRETESLNLSCRSDLSSSSSDSSTTSVDNCHDKAFVQLETAGGRRILSKLAAHPDYRVGIFPFVTRSAFRNASRRQLRSIERTSAEDSGSDIEMSPSLQRERSGVKRKLFVDTSEKMIELNDLSVAGYSHDHLGLCNVDLSIKSGSNVALLALNGGGKTTLFETLTLGNRIPMNGSASVFGHDIISDCDEICRENLIGYVSQEDCFLEFLTVRQTLKLMCSVKGLDLKSELRERDFLPNKYSNYPIRALSGGTKKKLALKIANLRCPRALLLDECTTGVDPVAADSIVQQLQINAQQQSCCVHPQGMLLASHRVDEAFAICDQVLMLVDGQTYLQGPSSTLLTLVNLYYQVDVYLTAFHQEGDGDSREVFLHRLFDCIDGRENLERVMTYSSTLLRLTFRKDQVSVTRLWNKLDMWRYHGYISKYLFRTMEMEELLASILAASKLEHLS